MDINNGLKICNNLLIKWDSKLKDVVNMCEENNIDFNLEKFDNIISVSISIDFANIGKVLATLYFADELINIIYITSLNQSVFSKDNYLNIDKKLIQYFGQPKHLEKNKTIWNLGKIKIKHYFVKKDDGLVDYLVLENLLKKLN